MRKENFRILVVDDERGFTFLVSGILKDAGYSVKSSSSPKDAIGVLDSYRPDLVISDLKMPGMNGIEFMTSAKEKYPDTDFVLITAFATVETAVSAMKLGAADYLTKPLKDPEELRRIVFNVF